MPRHHHGLALPALAILLAACAAPAAPPGSDAVAYVELTRPTVVAFVPASSRRPQGEEEAAARRQVSGALEHVKACLGSDYASYRLLTTDRIVVRTAGREQSFDVADTAPLVGALLLRPDAGPRIVFAGGGPEALDGMLRRAVADYFARECGG